MVRTDMAVELREMNGAGQLTGVTSDETQLDGIHITRVHVLNKQGADSLGKPIGNYITIESPALADRDADTAKKTTQVMADELKKMLGNKRGLTLVVGLGNWNMTPDALGPKVIDRILVTRHIKEYAPEYFDERLGVVCAISPGVLGITGIETSELVRGAVEKIKPDRVICVDSLASRRSQRITTSLQLCDTGISPGAGVANRRSGLNQETLGVPVFAIGVPMVVDAKTLVYDVVTTIAKETGKVDQALSEQSVQEAINHALFEKLGDMIVTPKEIDMLVSDAADIVADGINMALHNMSPEEIGELLY